MLHVEQNNNQLMRFHEKKHQTQIMESAKYTKKLWTTYISDPNHDHFHQCEALWAAAHEFEKGRRVGWVLGIWMRFLEQATPTIHPTTKVSELTRAYTMEWDASRRLPTCARRLRSAYDAVTADLTPQMRKKALLALRSLLSRVAGLQDVLRVMPRFVAARRTNPLDRGAVTGPTSIPHSLHSAESCVRPAFPDDWSRRGWATSYPRSWCTPGAVPGTLPVRCDKPSTWFRNS